MKNLPLTVQIWLLCVIVTLSVSALAMVFLPGMLQQFFTEQVLGILEDSQKNIKVVTVELQMTAIDGPSSLWTAAKTATATATAPVPAAVAAQTDADSKTMVAINIAQPIAAIQPVTTQKLKMINFNINDSVTTPSIPFMNHIYFSPENPLSNNQLPEPFRSQVIQAAAGQSESTRKYTSVNQDRTLLYVIRKTVVDGQQGNLLSYAWGTYRNDMAGTLYRKLMLLMLAAIVLSWIPSLLVSRHLTRPLIKMESHVNKIGFQECYEPLDLQRRDEIGRLASAFENMRERLIRQDQAQQAYLQNISHSLKTPIMVIQSYSKAILDGIYPKGDLSSSLLTIKSEADRTNKLVQDLLLLNKIKYLSTRDMKMEVVQFGPLIDEIAEKFSSRRPDLQWQMQFTDYSLIGDPDQWRVVLENLLDNATRYAASAIQILHNDNPGQAWWLRIWNDGVAVEESYLDKIFEEYYSGKDGQSGLGLAIVRHIVELHGGRVWATNENGGMAFYIGSGREINRVM